MPKRALHYYNVWIRDHYALPDIQALPVRERIRELAKRWQAQKSEPLIK